MGSSGGSLIADILGKKDNVFNQAKLFAAVRSHEQVDSLSKLAVKALQVDLSDKVSVEDAVVKNEIDIVVHTAGAVDARMPSNLISALGQRRRVSGSEIYYIHSSVATMFSEEGGWVYGPVKDTDPLLDKEEEIGGPNPVRLNNILVAEEGKAQDVMTLNVAVPMVYGRGTGEWRKLSVSIPAFVRTSIKEKTAYKFDKDSNPPATHISDLTALYMILLKNILKGNPVPTGKNGYYFALAHKCPWWKVMDGLAEGLYSRGLITEPEVKVWPSYDIAADTLGFPRLYIRAIGTSNGEQIVVNPYKLGWKPEWDEEKFLNSLDDEIQAVQELDTVKMSLFDSVITSDNN
ncbi:hypothetical protein FZEAL_4621 [Fusarium zealandicum]|uniref:3-beta hydroxysteroid dehydrogenase/isomerase domain-containing protein n=1 Tax=Fusarium zealandicum TaxID=1053134 RepID=A0A8H4XL98_9HYPO|nr:hypothetical protein FZEAL_4621 [Fusarium zealandicum]